ncbi:hypothetical protein C4D60_Mb09t17370 [Musa balbisiana]|uniref:Uncharacterized protein n=1 Tax=Musa balbisiana TaxID=52838 RepID=A0A4V4H3B2_MUSBA|nr:hypothetical protein C4D60_Mb09t17370 [Musa balbisiana]
MALAAISCRPVCPSLPHTHARPPPYPLLSSSSLSYLSIYNSSPSGFGFAHRYSAAQPSSRSSWENATISVADLSFS